MSLLRKLRVLDETTATTTSDPLKNGEAQDPHSWKLRTEFPTIADRKPVEVPDPVILRNLSLLRVPLAARKDASDLLNALNAFPDTGHMAVHLCLVECFVRLKMRATETESLDYFAKPKLPKYEDVKLESPGEISQIDIREQRWRTLLKLSFSRYRTWFASTPKILRHASVYSSNKAANKTLIELTKDYLPPLDVILFWYTHMLSPESYRSDCLEHKNTFLLHLGMPWGALSQAIDRTTFNFSLTKSAAALFRTLSHQDADILSYAAAPPPYNSDSDDSTLSFSIDLVPSVLSDEAAFIKTMHCLLWVRSPALSYTLQSAQRHYKQLWMDELSEKLQHPVSIESRQDIQLAWRTHVMHPDYYALFPDTKALPQSPLLLSSPSLSYHAICFCWAHQLLDSSTGRLLEPSIDELKDDLAYYVALEQARRSGQTLPVRAQTRAEKVRGAEELKKKKAAGVYVSWVDKEKRLGSWTGGTYGSLIGFGI